MALSCLIHYLLNCYFDILSFGILRSHLVGGVRI